MKKFVLFLVITIAVVSIGITVFYFSYGNEEIYIKNPYIVKRVGELISVNDLLDFKNESEHTTIDYDGVQDKAVLEYSANDGFYTAKCGGKTEIIIKTSNRNYSSLVINVTVCDGSENNPYYIYTADELAQIGNVDEDTTTNVAYRLVDEKTEEDETADATASATPYAFGSTKASYVIANNIEMPEDKVWTPINSFSGTFNGNGYSISKLNVNIAVTGNGGLFAQQSGTIQNVVLTDVVIEGGFENVGAIVGTNYGTVKCCHVTGLVSSSTSVSKGYVGGIVGKNVSLDKQAFVDRCAFEGSVKAYSQHTVGGVVGYNYGGRVSESYFRGNCNGSLTASFGGLVGLNEFKDNYTADLYDSYAYFVEEENQEGTPSKPSSFAGIVNYNKVKSTSSLNSVTGNYYGGSVDPSSVRVNCSGDELVNYSSYNKYLTVDEFKLQESFVSYSYNNDEKRTWNFESVWGMNTKYPELDFSSVNGSTYLIDITNLSTGNEIRTKEELRTALADTSATCNYTIVETINLLGYEWVPVVNEFKGILTCAEGAKIENLTIKNVNLDNGSVVGTGGYVGLVTKLGSSAIISNVTINKVTITGDDGIYVGVIAGMSEGANIYNVTINNVNVNIGGYVKNGSNIGIFGTLFGKAKDYMGHGIDYVSIGNVSMASNVFFNYAGGVVGQNYTTITSSKFYRNVANKTKTYLNGINLNGKQVGGVVGYNQGSISYVSVVSMNFNKEDMNSENYNTLFVGDFYLGGIAGRNIKGSIDNVIAKPVFKVTTGSDYAVYMGGIAGLSTGSISNAFVREGTELSTAVGTTSNCTAFIGGIVGDNSGVVTLSVFAQGAKVVASTTFVSKNVVNDSDVTLRTFNYSIVGGIAGYDRQTTSNNATISNCKVQGDITGFYAGGLVGYSYGKVEKCYVNGSKITGFYAGGLASIVASGYVQNCYSISTLKGVASEYSASDWENFSLYNASLATANQKVSAKAGFAVFTINYGTYMRTCYTVVNFEGEGINFGTTLTEVHLSEENRQKYNYGALVNCVYQNQGNYNNGGIHLTETQLKGVNQYSALLDAGFNATVWSFKEGGGDYPTLFKLDAALPQIVE